MDNQKKYKLSTNYLLYKEDEVSNDFYLFNVQNGEIFQINSTTYDFLSMCDGSREVVEIFRNLTKLYSIDFPTIRNDFRGLVHQWLQMGILLE
ncbi:MAG: PqqD family protein [Thermoguttaceae bacterium]|nr:PqqD family protein [Thermoguttaceae bacterium]